MQPSVSIIIVSYNTREMTVACIQSIIAETRRHAFEIIVVDNNSPDGSAEAIRERFPDVRLLASKENLGFAGGNNVGGRMATGRRILLLNPDTLVLNGAIDEILDFADRTPAARLWGGKAIFPDGTINASCWNDMTLWSLFCRTTGLSFAFRKSQLLNPESIHVWDRLDREREVDIVVGCFLLIDAALWRDLAGFNPAFYMYGDEVDLCLRARKLGARPRITPAATIIHYGGGSEPSSEDKLIKVFKGRITVMNVHWRPLAAAFGRILMLGTVVVRAVASTVVKPPRRQGSGRDGRTDVWGAVLRRRHEWSRGWPIKAPSS